jgi:hypothetical protein
VLEGDNGNGNVAQSKDNKQMNSNHYRTRSGRIIKKPEKYGNFISYQVYQTASTYEFMTEYMNPITYMSTSDPDTMYYHEILRHYDKEQFLDAMKLEISSHTTNIHWELINRSNIPPSQRVLPCV